MTPKGVEHEGKSGIDLRQFIAVKIPMTPKGVEHMVRNAKPRVSMGEDSNDAERR